MKTSPLGAVRSKRGPLSPCANSSATNPGGSLGQASAGRGTMCDWFPAERVAKGGGKSAGVMRRRAPGASLVQSPKARSPVKVGTPVSSPRLSVTIHVDAITVARAMARWRRRFISESDFQAVARYLPAGGVNRRAFGRAGAQHRVGVVD